MTLTPPTKLVPSVSELADRLVFEVQSRSTQQKRIVDMEKRHGLGECNCPNFQKGGNRDCWHLTQVRKYMAVRLAQAIINRLKK